MLSRLRQVNAEDSYVDSRANDNVFEQLLY